MNITSGLANRGIVAPSTGNLPLDDQIAHLLRRAHQRASALINGTLAERGLTSAQFFAMSRLYELGALSQNHLGRLAAMDPATIQGVIKRLVDRGWVRRSPDPSDKRRMTLRLTEPGEELISDLLPAAEQVHRDVLGPLSYEERQNFLSMLRRIA